MKKKLLTNAGYLIELLAVGMVAALTSLFMHSFNCHNQSDLRLEVYDSGYTGVMYANIGRNDGDVVSVGKSDLAKGKDSLRIHTVSTTTSKGKLSYAGHVLDKYGREREFAGNAEVFQVNDGYRIVRLIKSGTCSGPNSNSDDSFISSSSKETVTFRIYDVKIADGRGTLYGSEFTLPGLPVPERG